MRSNLDIKGVINIKEIKHGIIIAEYTFENLITNAGLDYFSKYIGGNYGPINKLGLGDDLTPPDVSDTALKNRLIMVDILGRDYSIPNSISLTTIIPENSFQTTVNFKEGGLIYKNGATEILITRVVFPQIVYQTSDSSLAISYLLKLQGV